MDTMTVVGGRDRAKTDRATLSTWLEKKTSTIHIKDKYIFEYLRWLNISFDCQFWRFTRFKD